MKITRLVWYAGGPLTFSGGGERLLLEGLRHFEFMGIQAALFTDGSALAPGHLFDGRYSPRTLITQRSPGPQRILRKVPTLRHALRLWEDAGAIAAFRPDYVIANSPGAAVSLLRMKLMGRLRGIPFACLIHGSLFQFSADREKYALVFRPYFRRVREDDPVYLATIPPRAPPATVWTQLKLELHVLAQWIAVKRAAVVFVLTQKNRREIELFYRHQNVRVAHGAFPRELLRYRPVTGLRTPERLSGKRVIFSLCRLEEKKRVDIIIRAFAMLVERAPDVALVIGGTGPDRERLQALAGELRISQSVVFPGFVPDGELYDYYLSADLFTSADIADFDLTTFVALALGRKAVVSSQHEFDPELGDLRQVFRAEPSPEPFAAAFEAALAAGDPCDAETRAKLLAGYTWETYFETLKRVMEHSARPRTARR